MTSILLSAGMTMTESHDSVDRGEAVTGFLDLLPELEDHGDDGKQAGLTSPADLVEGNGTASQRKDRQGQPAQTAGAGARQCQRPGAQPRPRWRALHVTGKVSGRSGIGRQSSVIPLPCPSGLLPSGRLNLTSLPPNVRSNVTINVDCKMIADVKNNVIYGGRNGYLHGWRHQGR
jgi:hypothetical protein